MSGCMTIILTFSIILLTETKAYMLLLEEVNSLLCSAGSTFQNLDWPLAITLWPETDWAWSSSKNLLPSFKKPIFRSIFSSRDTNGVKAWWLTVHEQWQHSSTNKGTKSVLLHQGGYRKFLGDVLQLHPVSLQREGGLWCLFFPPETLKGWGNGGQVMWREGASCWRNKGEVALWDWSIARAWRPGRLRSHRIKLDLLCNSKQKWSCQRCQASENLFGAARQICEEERFVWRPSVPGRWLLSFLQSQTFTEVWVETSLGEYQLLLCPLSQDALNAERL